MDPEALRNLRKQNAVRADLDKLGWYHSFRFEDGSEFRGILPVELSEYRYSKFPIPADLRGKTLLDIGAWDGWFSFEAERHGADVTALDVVEVQNFWKVHRKLRSRVKYRELNVFDIPDADLGTFDYVFFLGVLYHTRYPLLALETVCGLTREVAIVESYVTDAGTWEQHRDEIPSMEFYEADELGGQLDNWFGPTVGCMAAMCRAAGFARVEVLHVEDNRAALACYRKWPRFEVDGNAPAVRVQSLRNAVRGGINFRRNREEYLTYWFEYDGADLHRDEIRIEIGDLGVPVIYTAQAPGGLWFASSMFPHGLDAGWHTVRMSVRSGPWTEPISDCSGRGVAAGSGGDSNVVRWTDVGSGRDQSG